MTPYEPRDLADHWEFKILRSVAGRFRNPEWLRAVLAEEARAGWSLVEKFDNARIRLKRPASAQAGDAALDFDARRTYVGMGQTLATILIVLGTLAAIGLLTLILALLMH